MDVAEDYVEVHENGPEDEYMAGYDAGRDAFIFTSLPTTGT